MKTINLNVTLAALDGAPVTDEGGRPLNLRHIVGNLIYRAPTKDDALRQARLAQTIYDGDGPIQLEDADFELMCRLVEGAGLSCALAALFQRQKQAALEGKGAQA